eukprot:ANDGO_03168.mRNA.1 hypothetical protein GUITHDRAFT_89280
MLELARYARTAVQCDMMESLGNLCSIEALCFDLVDYGILQVIAVNMVTNVPEIQYESAKLLHKLASFDEFKEEIVAVGILIPLLGLCLLNNMYGKTRLFALLSLESLVREAWVRQNVVEANGLQPLEAVSMSDDPMVDPLVKDTIAKVLTYFSEGNVRVDQVTGESSVVYGAGKGVRTLFLMLDHPDEDIRTEGAWALANYAENDTNRQEIIHSRGLLKLHAQFSTSKYLPLLFQISRAFANLSKISSLDARLQFSEEHILSDLAGLICSGIPSSSMHKELRRANLHTFQNGKMHRVMERTERAMMRRTVQNLDDTDLEDVTMTVDETLDACFAAIQQYAAEGTSFLAEIPRMAAEICTLGCFPSLLTILDTETNYDAQLHAANTFLNMSTSASKAFYQELSAASGLPIVVGLLKRTPEKSIRVSLLSILYELGLRFPEVRNEVGSLGTFSSLARLLQETDMDIIICVMKVFSVMMLAQQNLFRLHAENVLKLIISFAFSIREDVRSEAVKVIHVMAQKEEFIDELMDLGVVRPLLSICRLQGDQHRLTQAVEALGAIIHDSTLHFYDPDRIVVFHKEGAVDVLMEILRQDHQQADALSNSLMLVGDLSHEMEARVELVQKGAVPEIIKYLSHDNTGVNQASCYALIYILQDESAAANMMEEGGHETLFQFLNCRVKGLERYAFQALAQLASFESAQTALIRLDLFSIFKDRLFKESDDIEFQLACAKGLKNLARHPLAAPFLERGGTMKKIIDFVKSVVPTSLLKDLSKSSESGKSKARNTSDGAAVSNEEKLAKKKRKRRRTLLRKIISRLLTQVDIGNSKLQAELLNMFCSSFNVSESCQKAFWKSDGVQVLTVMARASDRDLRIAAVNSMTSLLRNDLIHQFVLDAGILELFSSFVDSNLLVVEEANKAFSELRNIMDEIFRKVKASEKAKMGISPLQSRIDRLAFEKLDKIGHALSTQKFASLVNKSLASSAASIQEDHHKNRNESVESKLQKTRIIRSYIRAWSRCKYRPKPTARVPLEVLEEFTNEKFLKSNLGTLASLVSIDEEMRYHKNSSETSQKLLRAVLLFLVTICKIRLSSRTQVITVFQVPRLLQFTNLEDRECQELASDLFLDCVHDERFAEEHCMRRLCSLCLKPPNPYVAARGPVSLNDVCAHEAFRVVLAETQLFLLAISAYLEKSVKGTLQVSAVRFMDIAGTFSVDEKQRRFLVEHPELWKSVVRAVETFGSKVLVDEDFRAESARAENKEELLSQDFETLEQEYLFHALRCVVMFSTDHDLRSHVSTNSTVAEVAIRLCLHSDVRFRRLAVRTVAELALSVSNHASLLALGAVRNLARNISFKRYKDVCSEAVRGLALLSSTEGSIEKIAAEGIVAFVLEGARGIDTGKAAQTVELNLDGLIISIRRQCLRLLAQLCALDSVKQEISVGQGILPLINLSQDPDTELSYNALRCLHRFCVDERYHECLFMSNCLPVLLQLMTSANVEYRRLVMFSIAGFAAREQSLEKVLQSRFFEIAKEVLSAAIFDVRYCFLRIIRFISFFDPLRILESELILGEFSAVVQSLWDDHSESFSDFALCVLDCYNNCLPDDRRHLLQFETHHALIIHAVAWSEAFKTEEELRNAVLSFVHFQVVLVRRLRGISLSLLDKEVSLFCEVNFDDLVHFLTKVYSEEEEEIMICQMLEVLLSTDSGIAAVHRRLSFFEILTEKAFRDVNKSSIRQPLSRVFCRFMLEKWSRNRLLGSELFQFTKNALSCKDVLTDYYIAFMIAEVLRQNIIETTPLLQTFVKNLFDSGVIEQYAQRLKAIALPHQHTPLTYETCRLICNAAGQKDYVHLIVHYDVLEIMLSFDKECGRLDIALISRATIYYLLYFGDSETQSDFPVGLRILEKLSDEEVSAMFRKVDVFKSEDSKEELKRAVQTTRLLSIALHGEFGCNQLVRCGCVPFILRKIVSANEALSMAALSCVDRLVAWEIPRKAVISEGFGPVLQFARTAFPEQRRVVASKIIVELLRTADVREYLASKSDTFTFPRLIPYSSELLDCEMQKYQAQHRYELVTAIPLGQMKQQPDSAPRIDAAACAEEQQKNNNLGVFYEETPHIW